MEGLQRDLSYHGYKQCQTDRNVWYKRDAKQAILIAGTIDDFCFAASSATAYRKLLADLRTKCRAKDLGAAKRLLGWSIRKIDGEGLHMSQPYLGQSLIDLVLTSAERETKTPYAHELDISPRHESETVLEQYQPIMASGVGILRYLVDSTRPYLAYLTSALAAAVNESTRRHKRALVQVARYMRATLHHGIAYRRSTLDFRAASDSDFAGCTRTRRSTMGHLVWLGDYLVSWQSRRIKTVVISTCAAEYIAASTTAEELQWIRELLGHYSAANYRPRHCSSITQQQSK